MLKFKENRVIAQSDDPGYPLAGCLLKDCFLDLNREDTICILSMKIPDNG